MHLSKAPEVFRPEEKEASQRDTSVDWDTVTIFPRFGYFEAMVHAWFAG